MSNKSSITSALLGLGKAALVAMILVLLYVQFASIDGSAMLGLLTRIGTMAPVILLPFAGILALDALGWRLVLPSQLKVGVRSLFLIRLGTDAVQNSVPAGVILAETLRALLLRRDTGLSLPSATASTLLAKVNIAIAQALFLIMGIIAIATAQHGASETLLPGNTLGISIVVGIVPVTLLIFVYSGRLFGPLLRAVYRMSPPVLKERLSAFPSSGAHIDAVIRERVHGDPSRFMSSLGVFTLSWIAMAGETWFILHLLGSELSLLQALTMEAAASLTRVAFFFIPGSIGAQDVTYAGMTAVLLGGPPVELAAAFLLLRRGREVVYWLAGYGVLGLLRINPFAPVHQQN
jgi:hypothetical protein